MALVAAYRTDAVVLAKEVNRLRAVLQLISRKSATVFCANQQTDDYMVEHDLLYKCVNATITMADAALDGER